MSSPDLKRGSDDPDFEGEKRKKSRDIVVKKAENIIDYETESIKSTSPEVGWHLINGGSLL